MQIYLGKAMQNSTKLEQRPFLGTFGKSKITVIEPNCLILNDRTALELKHTVDACLSLNAPSQTANVTLLVDMHNVESIDSNGLIMLLSIFKTAIANKTSLVFCSIQTQVRLIFEISKMDRTFTIFDDYDALVAHIEIKAELNSFNKPNPSNTDKVLVPVI
jgi:anti-sigma B factor antagonist